MIRILTAFLLLWTHLAWAGETQLAAPPPSVETPRRIVMVLADGDPAKMNSVFNNIANIQNFYGKDRVAIELVAYGPGIVALLREGSPVRGRVDSARSDGVRVVACRVSLATQDKGDADLIDGVESVASGLPEIVERQLSGWVYLRP